MAPSTAEINSSHDGNETCERLLAAAERLFAERGFEATSVRDITTEAGCNVAAVNYHFGGKENLYRESFRALLAELRSRRIERIRRDLEATPEMGLEGFLESFANAFVEPLADESRGRLAMAFFAREMVDRHLPGELFVEEFVRPLLEVSAVALDRVGPPMDSMTQRLCLMSVVGQLIHALRAHQHFVPSGSSSVVPPDLREQVRHIVRFSAGGIRACAAAPVADGDNTVVRETTS